MNNKDKKRVDQDIRPKLWFSNYDYVGPEEATEISPGKGLYNGKMDKYKSVKDFIEQKRKRRRELKNAKFTSDQLLKAATRFSQLVAQETSIDYSAIDSVKQVLTPLVMAEYNKGFLDKAVSSTEVRVYYENGKAMFKVESTGTDAANVQRDFEQLLNNKFAKKAAQVISKSIGNKPATFNFQLATIET
jgi:hypothetical protein